jgi:hypothetical protein
VITRNPNIRTSAKVTGNHGAILRKNYPAIAEAVREVAALDSAPTTPFAPEAPRS